VDAVVEDEYLVLLRMEVRPAQRKQQEENKGRPGKDRNTTHLLLRLRIVRVLQNLAEETNPERILSQYRCDPIDEAERLVCYCSFGIDDRE